MPDTPELTPPPDEPLLDATRAEIRQRLSAATQTEEQRPGNRWLVPGLAAAAVLTVVAGAFAVASTNDDGAGEGSSLQPAGSETTQSATTPPGGSATPSPSGGSVTSTPSEDPAGSAIPTPSLLPSQPTNTVPLTEPPQVAGATSCADEVSQFAKVQEPALQGATVTAERDSAAGTTYLYETKLASVVCDDSTAVLGGPESGRGYMPTLVSSHLKSESYQPDKDTLAVSMNFIGSADYISIESAYFLAAGRDFDGVQAISYTFPDGHTERAVVGENGLWSMAYVITDRPTLKLYNDSSQLDPVDVTVTSTGGDTTKYTLQWGLDTCAQLNHGC